MANFALDSSCMVAAVCTWHGYHAAVAAEFEKRLGRGDRLVAAAHTLVETYAVLTRLPSPHRLSTVDAWALVQANFVDLAELATLSPRRHVALLENLAGANVGGGRTYDALIAATVERFQPLDLLTLNPRHFEARDGLTIVIPVSDTEKP